MGPYPRPTHSEHGAGARGCGVADPLRDSNARWSSTTSEVGVCSTAYIWTGKFNSFPQKSGLKNIFFLSSEPLIKSHMVPGIYNSGGKGASQVNRGGAWSPVCSTPSSHSPHHIPPNSLETPPSKRLHRALKTFSFMYKSRLRLTEGWGPPGPHWSKAVSRQGYTYSGHLFPCCFSLNRMSSYNPKL